METKVWVCVWGTLITAAVPARLPTGAVVGVPFRDSAFVVPSCPHPWTPYQCRHITVDPGRSTNLLDESFRPAPHPPQMDVWYDQRLQSWFPFQFQYQPFLAYNQEKIRQTKLLHWRWPLQFWCDWCGCQIPIHEELSQWPSNSSLVFRYSVKHLDPGAAEGRLLGRQQYLPFLASCGVEGVYSKEAFLCCLEKHKGRRKVRVVQDLPAKLEFQKDIARWLGTSGYNLVILVFSCPI